MYIDYQVSENPDGTFTAYELDGPCEGVPSTNAIITAPTENILEMLMARLDLAYCKGVVDGIAEQKEEIRKKLGL